jgi:hypothetical protein
MFRHKLTLAILVCHPVVAAKRTPPPPTSTGLVASQAPHPLVLPVACSMLSRYWHAYTIAPTLNLLSVLGTRLPMSLLLPGSCGHVALAATRTPLPANLNLAGVALLLCLSLPSIVAINSYMCLYRALAATRTPSLQTLSWRVWRRCCAPASPPTRHTRTTAWTNQD